MISAVEVFFMSFYFINICISHVHSPLEKNGEDPKAANFIDYFTKTQQVDFGETGSPFLPHVDYTHAKKRHEEDQLLLLRSHGFMSTAKVLLPFCLPCCLQLGTLGEK